MPILGIGAAHLGLHGSTQDVLSLRTLQSIKREGKRFPRNNAVLKSKLRYDTNVETVW